VQLAYDRTYYAPRKQHAIKILRQLFAQSLNYEFVDNQPDYGIDLNRLAVPPITLPEKYVVFIHATNWVTKCWPEAYWYELAKKVSAEGYPILLPWGAEHEHERAKRIAAECSTAIVLPKLRLAELATILSRAKAAVCVDTGLGHLTAALNIPAVTLYGPTNPALIGATGLSQKHLVANFPCAPCKLKVCSYKKTTEQQPACFMTIPTQKVWDEFAQLI
jgi:heptosyltransferase-1